MWAAEQVRRYLIQVALLKDEFLPTYGDVGAVCERHPLAVGRILELVVADCQRRGEPDLTVLVINKKTKVCSKFLGKFAVDGRSYVDAWRDAVAGVRSWPWSADAATGL